MSEERRCTGCNCLLFEKKNKSGDQVYGCPICFLTYDEYSDEKFSGPLSEQEVIDSGLPLEHFYVSFDMGGPVFYKKNIKKTKKKDKFNFWKSIEPVDEDDERSE